MHEPFRGEERVRGDTEGGAVDDLVDPARGHGDVFRELAAPPAAGLKRVGILLADQRSAISTNRFARASASVAWAFEKASAGVPPGSTFG